MIQFTSPSNDGPVLIPESYTISTTYENSVSTAVYVRDSDFYEYYSDTYMLMKIDISVINGTISLPNVVGLTFSVGNPDGTSLLTAYGDIMDINTVRIYCILIFYFVYN